jgi:hypothetical protein
MAAKTMAPFLDLYQSKKSKKPLIAKNLDFVNSLRTG